MVSVSTIAPKLVEYIARLAVGLPVDDNDLRRISGSILYPVMREVVRRVAVNIVTTKNGLPRCNICGKGPFTRRGLYLHLVRVHRYDIIAFTEEEYKKIMEVLSPLDRKY